MAFSGALSGDAGESGRVDNANQPGGSVERLPGLGAAMASVTPFLYRSIEVKILPP